MKIDTSRTSPATPATPQKNHPQITGSPEAASSPAADDAVTSHLQKTSGTNTAQAPFDSQRVAEIRQAITEGRFQINTDKIAERLIGGVRDFLAKNQSTS